MKSCQISGNMGAYWIVDRYPTVPVCDKCVEIHSLGKGAEIITVDDYDELDGSKCFFCHLSINEEEDDDNNVH